MSHFYGTMQGGAKEVSRTGDSVSGMQAHVRGWDVGIRVVCTYEDGHDVCRVWLTSGSRDTLPSKLIGVFTRDQLELGRRIYVKLAGPSEAQKQIEEWAFKEFNVSKKPTDY